MCFFSVAPSDIKVTGNPPNRILNAGIGLTLTCEMKGTPRPHIYWVLNRKIVSFDSFRRVFNGTTFTVAREKIYFSRIEFRPLRRFDDGEYTCFGSNYGGVIEKKYSLDVNCEYLNHSPFSIRFQLLEIIVFQTGVQFFSSCSLGNNLGM